MQTIENLTQEAQRRDVNYFMHFTNALNLPSILEYGLLPRDKLEYVNADAQYNDTERLDGYPNSISLSITFPNYKMFYKLRMTHPNKYWAVIVLKADIILKLDCAFCKTNAASNEIRHIPIENRKGYKAFVNIFQNIPEFYSRKEMNLTDDEPTDPQAEVLVFDRIPVESIEYIFFEDTFTYNNYKSLLNKYNIECGCNDRYFRPRHDYKYWQ